MRPISAVSLMRCKTRGGFFLVLDNLPQGSVNPFVFAIKLILESAQEINVNHWQFRGLLVFVRLVTWSSRLT